MQWGKSAESTSSAKANALAQFWKSQDAIEAERISESQKRVYALPGDRSVGRMLSAGQLGNTPPCKHGIMERMRGGVTFLSASCSSFYVGFPQR